MLKNITVLILVPVFVLLALEAGFRVYESVKNDFGTKETYHIGYLLEAPFRHFVYLPNRDENGEHSGHTHFTTNAFGYRGKNFSIKKAQGVFRVACIGDSVTFGVGASVDATAYPARLEGLLQNQFSGMNIEVINAGIPGYASTHAFVFLVTELVKLEPDLLVIFLGWNDLSTSVIRGWNSDRRFGFFYGQDISQEEESRAKRFNDLLLKHSALMRRMDKTAYKIRKHFQKKQRKAQNIDLATERKKELEDIFNLWESRQSRDMYQYAAKDIFESNLNNILEFAKAKNMKLLVLTWPTLLSDNMTEEEKIKCAIVVPHFIYSNKAHYQKLYHEYNSLIHGITSRQGVSLLDAARQFSLLERKADYFFDLFHLSDAGCTYLAQIVSEKIKEEGLIRQ